MNNSIQGICINFIEKVLEVVGRDEVWQLSELETGLGKLKELLASKAWNRRVGDDE